MGSDVNNGIVSGLVGGIVFGIMMQMMTAPTPEGGQMPDGNGCQSSALRQYSRRLVLPFI